MLSHLSKDSCDTKILSTCWPRGGLTISVQDIADAIALVLEYLVPDMSAITNALVSAIDSVIGPLLQRSFPGIYQIYLLVVSILDYDLDYILQLISNTFNINFPSLPNINDYLRFDFDFGMLDTIPNFEDLFTDLLDDVVDLPSTILDKVYDLTGNFGIKPSWLDCARPNPVDLIACIGAKVSTHLILFHIYTIDHRCLQFH